MVSGAEQLAIKQSKTLTRFRFSPARSFSLQQITETLLQSDAVHPGPVEHLAIGLRAVGFGDGRPFTVTLRHTHKEERLIWDGEQLARQVKETRQRLVEIQVEVSFPPESSGRRLFGLARGAGLAVESDSF